eukprot:TRINITY_DN75981_c0_g1_i1.p1 TRINITY_DN75981_c0_g1~~TRINITY_DN75981_c0_g1_i1.p1  ORF type:complete len:374 (-),score=60.02 TRINITY_DN75981_c0_g1_i1:148-1269(-)
MFEIADAGENSSRFGGGTSAESGTWRAALGSWTRRSQTAPLPAAEAGEDLKAPLASTAPVVQDLELGEDVAQVASGGGNGERRWVSWAKQAAGRVQQHASDAAGQAQQGLAHGLEKAKSVNWDEKVKGVRSGVARGLDRVSDGTSSVELSRNTSLDENGIEFQRSFSDRLGGVVESASSAQKAAREMAGRGLQTISDSQTFQAVKGGASSAASSARGSLSVAGERVSGAATIARDPVRLGRSITLFLLGVILILCSLQFLPILLIAPGRFSSLFTFGSLMILASSVLLNGPQHFIAQYTQRDKLPFSVTYVVGLVGTLWATSIQKSYIFTAVFALVQAASLIFFISTSIPGGRAGLGLLGRLGGMSARALVRG